MSMTSVAVESRMDTYVEKLSHVFTELMNRGGEERRDIELANFIELSVATILGREHVKQFLYDLVHC